MKKQLVLSLALMFAVTNEVLGSETTQSATAPAATQGSAIEWTAVPPNAPYRISVSRPGDWQERKHSNGQPFIYKAGPEEGTLQAWWEFDIKTGLKGRTTQELLTQFTAAVEKRGAKVIKKELVDRRDGSKAGIVEYTMEVPGSPKMTVRDYFFALDKDHLLVATEYTAGVSGLKHGAALAAITESIKVTKK